MKKCKHDFKTLQQQIIGKVYVEGLIQCKKCLKCFDFGPEGVNERCLLRPTKINEVQ